MEPPVDVSDPEGPENASRGTFVADLLGTWPAPNRPDGPYSWRVGMGGGGPEKSIGWTSSI